MSGKIDYKQKYQELKATFMSAVDSAWNDGFQHGLEAAQLDQAQQALAQPQPGMEGAPGEQPSEGMGEENQPMSGNPEEDELGKHIEKLESMLGKSELSSLQVQDIKKTLNDIRSLQTQISLTKSMDVIKTKKMKKSYIPLNISPKLQANLPQQAKNALSLQEKIVGEIFKKWEKDEDKAVSEITSAIKIEGLTKNEKR